MSYGEVQGPINKEPEEKLDPDNKPTGIRKLYVLDSNNFLIVVIDLKIETLFYSIINFILNNKINSTPTSFSNTTTTNTTTATNMTTTTSTPHPISTNNVTSSNKKRSMCQGNNKRDLYEYLENNDENSSDRSVSDHTVALNSSRSISFSCSSSSSSISSSISRSGSSESIVCNSCCCCLEREMSSCKKNTTTTTTTTTNASASRKKGKVGLIVVVMLNLFYLFICFNGNKLLFTCLMLLFGVVMREKVLFVGLVLVSSGCLAFTHALRFKPKAKKKKKKYI